MKIIPRVLLGAAAVSASALAFAAPGAAIDVAETVTGVTNQVAAITAVGAGALAIAVAVRAFKWVRSALS